MATQYENIEQSEAYNRFIASAIITFAIVLFIVAMTFLFIYTSNILGQ